MLRDPITINSITLRNRLVMPPMATGRADRGCPTEELERYYGLRARGTGLIIVEHEYVSREGMAHSTQLSTPRAARSLPRSATLAPQPGTPGCLPSGPARSVSRSASPPCRR